MKQKTRLYAYLRTHPQASTLEIQDALKITNATGRLSDLRKLETELGFVVVKERRFDGRDGYSIRVVEPTEQLAIGLSA